MKTFLFIVGLFISLQVSAQTNHKLDFEKFVIEYDTICRGEKLGCSFGKGMIIITNDTIEYGGVKYFMTHKDVKDGIKFCATSVRSSLHQIVVSGDYIIHGLVRLTFINSSVTASTIQDFYFPIRSINADGRKHHKIFVKSK